ncbi:hypothetical protein ACFY3M_13480 [Streptomyces mirabilis]|uniref:hypothetical protein n=1 Tax=Streptomyces mirabilis TaxID=68239 RepID=UPI0036B81F3C
MTTRHHRETDARDDGSAPRRAGPDRVATYALPSGAIAFSRTGTSRAGALLLSVDDGSLQHDGVFEDRARLDVVGLLDLDTAAAEVGVRLGVEDLLGAIAALLVDVGQGDALASRGVLDKVHHHKPGELDPPQKIGSPISDHAGSLGTENL